LYGIKIVPPQNATPTPWVLTFDVKRGWRHKAELNWRLSDASDVKGFNVYKQTPESGLVKVNGDLVGPKTVDRLTYRFNDPFATKDGKYVIELVRETPDPATYFTYEREDLK
jgi:hypothetical protein